MNRRTRISHVSAFTLVELLVVIAIIALLIGIAMPAFRSARNSAKKTATKAVLTSIESGLQSYREEQALGAVYPPSQSDKWTNNYPVIVDPVETSGDEVRITGASLLVYALAGADLQGTRGFKRVGSVPTWAQSMSAAANIDPNGTDGLYSQIADPPWPKFGPYAGSNLLDRVSTLRSLEKFPLQLLSDPNSGQVTLTAPELVQHVFVDDFGGPILYYKARSAARRMITNWNSNDIGIYDFRDNRLLSQHTGSELRTTKFFGDSGFGIQPGSFDSFILDRKASRLASDTGPVNVDRPARPDDFLLISAGPDMLYGTKDDVVNWNK